MVKLRSLAMVPALLGLVFVMGAGAAAPAPQITDKAGDANGLNDQQLVPRGDPDLEPVLAQVDDADGNGTGTGPVSYSPADIRGVLFETTYSVTQVGNGTTYTPTGLKIHISTEATPKSDGPTMIYRVSGLINGCDSIINAFIHGPQAAADDPATGTIQWRQFGTATQCPNGNPAADFTFSNPAWVAAVGNKEIVVQFPYSSLTPAQLSYLQAGATLSGIEGSVRPNIAPPKATTPVASTKPSVTAPNIDSTAVLATPWTIGSDVPPNVVCTIGCP